MIDQTRQIATFPVNVRRCMAAATVALAFLMLPGTGMGQTTVTQSATTATAMVAAADADSDTTHSIVLVGELAGLDSTSPRKEPFPGLVDATTQTLGTDVANFTSIGLTLAETAKAIESAPRMKADIAIVIGGYADERDEVSAEDMRQSIIDIGATLRKRNADIHVYLVPSATYMSTLTNARMRLAADDAGLTFIPLGTEVSGQPFVQSLQAIRDDLLGPETSPEEVVESPAPAPRETPVIVDERPDSEAAPQDVQVDYEAKQASLRRELDRIAGDVADDLPSDDALSTSTFLADDPSTSAVAEETPLPPGGIVTKRGAEAQENINMRPLPALKAYRPQIPVPRNEIDKKEPALSR